MLFVCVCVCVCVVLVEGIYGVRFRGPVDTYGQSDVLTEYTTLPPRCAQCPVLIGWGEEDPWEPVELGRAYGEIATVEEFVVLPGVGHCPQDEAPHLVNPLITRFVAKYS